MFVIIVFICVYIYIYVCVCVCVYNLIPGQHDNKPLNECTKLHLRHTAG